jgi:FkbM family methyltransferase
LNDLASHRNVPLVLAGKAWPFLRRGDLRGLWRAARHRAEVKKWYRDDINNARRFDYPLTCESTVFDIGGYQGHFSREIVARYDPRVYVFEPVPQFYQELVAQFERNPKVRICNYGLSNQDSISQMTVAGDGSTIYMIGDRRTGVRLRDVQAVVRELGISQIDLVKINIEGGEYVLLRRMLETGLVSICQHILIQFHEFYPDARKLRSEIRTALQRTHVITYDYPFVWENWRRRSPDRQPKPERQGAS